MKCDSYTDVYNHHFVLISELYVLQYGCSRGVLGTPFFFVNGFALPNPGSAVDYKTWRSIIDPLVARKGMKKQEFVHFF